MVDGDNRCGTIFTFAVVTRGDLNSINELIAFLNSSDLTIAHKEIGQEKLYIKKGGAQ